MMELRPNCEHCNKDLPPDSREAMICSFECTYCRECALVLFKNVCPGCSGNFVPRPIRPIKYLVKYPESDQRVYAPKKMETVRLLIKEFEHIPPEER